MQKRTHFAKKQGTKSHRSKSGGGFYKKNKGKEKFLRNKAKKNAKKIDPRKYVAQAKAATKSSFKPSVKFNSLNITKVLKDNIAKQEHQFLTEIQEHTIPKILQGKDIVGVAKTGSGKTNAFLIPMIHKIVTGHQQKVLVIAPTRELALQIEKEAKKLIGKMQVYTVTTIGGVGIERQIRDLKRSHQIVIATPGRLKDLFERSAINLKSFNNIVLDEVDRMLDMGFVHEITFLLSKLKKERQTILFSATISDAAEKIVKTVVQNPVKIQIDNPAPNANITQNIVRIQKGHNKLEELVNIIRSDRFKKILVFMRTKRGCDKATRSLRKKRMKIDAMHGDKTQNNRQKVLKRFAEGKSNVLIATDVAARGIDVKDIDLVINYDEPESYDDYIHRIGRTGRAEKKGQALTFIQE